MKIGIVVEGQMGLTYAQQLALAQRAESLGFDAFYRTDHYESFPGPADQATSDAWSVLAGLARETKTIALGTLVSPVTFRYPGEYAKVVATVQEMAGRRMHAGLGAGWHESGIVATASVSGDASASGDAGGAAQHCARSLVWTRRLVV